MKKSYDAQLKEPLEDGNEGVDRAWEIARL
jgi:hypothetical protein